MTDYWEECISEACEDAGLTVTQEQVDTIASWVEGAHDNYGMAHGYDAIPNPLVLENERLKREFDLEKSKITCPECKGEGRIIDHGPCHTSESNCSKCRGEGRIVQ